jgi:hypothetical protein
MTSSGKGDLSDSVIARQMAVLNEAFGPWGFEFVAEGPVNRVTNDEWAAINIRTGGGRSRQTAMKSAHRQGTLQDLNLYITELTGGILGYVSYLPSQLGGRVKQDGVVVTATSLPGVKAWPYDEGDTVTHEAGHWLGLYHTFQGGCSSRGDHVDDTPAEKKRERGGG